MSRSKTVLVMSLVVLISISFTAYLFGFTVPKKDRLFLTPITGDARGWEIYFLNDGAEIPLTPEEARSFQDVVYMRRTISETWAQRGYNQILLSSERLVSVFVGSGLVYSNTPGAPAEIPVPFDLSLYQQDDIVRPLIFSIDPDWAGRTLIIASQAPDGTMDAPMSCILTSEDIEFELNAAITNRMMIPAVIFGVLGILMLLVFAYGLLRGSIDPGLLILASAAFVQMLYHIQSRESVILYMASIFQPLFLLLPMLYTALQMKKRRKQYAVILLACWGINYVVFILSYILFLQIPTEIVLFTPYLIFVPMVTLLLFGNRERREGNGFFKQLLPCAYTGLALLSVLFILSLLLAPVLQDQVNTVSIFFGTIKSIIWDAADRFPQRLQDLLSSMLLLLLFVLALLRQIQHSLKAAEYTKILAVKNELMLDNLHHVERIGQTLAIYHHDELHHLRTLAALCKEDSAEAAAYADSLIKELSNVPPLRYTDNKLINAILSVQAEHALSKGVSFQAKALLSERLSIPDKDVCAVLMNLLENAVNAASQAIEATRTVAVHLTIEEGRLQIIIENSLPKDFDFSSFHSGKQTALTTDVTSHGWGIKSVSAVLERYEGELRYSMKDGNLLLHTGMQMVDA